MLREPKLTPDDAKIPPGAMWTSPFCDRMLMNPVWIEMVWREGEVCSRRERNQGVKEVEVHGSAKVCGDVQGREDWVGGSGIEIGDENLEGSARKERTRFSDEGGRWEEEERRTRLVEVESSRVDLHLLERGSIPRDQLLDLLRSRESVGDAGVLVVDEGDLFETGEEEERERQPIVVDEAVLDLEDLGGDGRKVFEKRPEFLGWTSSSACDCSKGDEKRKEARPGLDEVFLLSFLCVFFEDDLLDERSEVGRRRESSGSFEGGLLPNDEDEGVEEDGSKEGGELVRDEGEMDEISLRESSLEDEE